MMEHFSGNIKEGNRVLFENVEGELFVNAPPGRAKSWQGTFHLPSAKDIERGRLYRLELDDGRSGDIRIKSIQDSSSSDVQTVEFRGHGPLE